MSENKEDFNIAQDYNYSRATYYELIDKGRESLDLMMDVARESEHPRAFEVLSGMIKNIAEINGSLMDLNKKNKETKLVGKEKKQTGTTNNNVFIGSTTDLQRMLLDANAKIEKEIDEPVIVASEEPVEWNEEETDARMNVIAQNGNTGEHYDS